MTEIRITEEKKHSLIFKIWRVLYPLLIFLGIQIICSIVMIIFYAVTVMISGAQSGASTADLSKQLMDWAISQSLLLALVSDALFLPLGIFFYLREKKGQKKTKLSSFKVRDYILVVGLAIFADFSITYIISAFDLIRFFPDYQNIMAGIGSGSLLLQIVAVGIVAPIAEEFLMRGVVLNRLLKYVGVIPAVLIQAALFGILHMNILQGTYAAVLGILLGYVYIKYKSLLMTIVFHITLNTLSVLFPENLLEGVNPFIIIASALVLTTGTIYLINRFQRPLKAEEPAVSSGS